MTTELESLCLIWSFEHRAWWGPPPGLGYTEDIAAAGQYTLEWALDICRKANIPAINEAIVPLDDFRFQAALPTGYGKGGRR